MSNNKEEKIYKDKLHLFLALQRMSKQGEKRCIRSIIKHDEEHDLKVFSAKIKSIGGEWRIYRTVNARDVSKAYKVFMKMMIDYPERASCIDSIWRTALLQRECKFEKYFMLDVDTIKPSEIEIVQDLITGNGLEMLKIIKSPSGFHIITKPFDTRKICKLDYVTLLRDGYYYIKTIQ